MGGERLIGAEQFMMGSAPVNSVAESRDRLQGLGLWIPLLFVWLMTVMTFSAPEREGPESLGSLDAIALGKVAIRFGGLLCFGVTIAGSWRHPRRRLVGWCLWPWGLYIGWAIVSTFWSPLKSVSLGQAFGLMVQLMLAFVLALRCRDLESVSKTLFHLSMALLAYGVVALTIFTISPELAGFSRGGWGMYHPTAVGAAASLGIVILIAARLLWGWRWSRAWLVPGLLIHTILLLLAVSRTAIAMGMVTVWLFLLLFSRRLVVSGVLAAIGFSTAGYIALDPGLELANRLYGTVSIYTMRGETEEDLKTATGRTVLWEAIWDEFKRSPLIGHGYFVTSQEGKIDVWSGPGNRTAHNVLLQVLVSTGVIGAILFLWGLIQPLVACGQSLRNDPERRKLAVFLGLFGMWYFGWGMFCESFMGPVQPESVVFFTLLGLGVGVFSSGRQAGLLTHRSELIH